MSFINYPIQHVYKYTRKTLGENRCSGEGIIICDDPDCSPSRSCAEPPYPCEGDSDIGVASILHKKCPVITLAQEQLQKLLDDADLCDPCRPRCCRSVNDFLCLLKECLFKNTKCRCLLFSIIISMFFFGLLLGAASCGTRLGRFQSPLLQCIDNYFISDRHVAIEYTYKAIV